MKWVAFETIWSKNMKKSIASMIQLDMDKIFHHDFIESKSFTTEEVGNDWWEHPRDVS